MEPIMILLMLLMLYLIIQMFQKVRVKYLYILSVFAEH